LSRKGISAKPAVKEHKTGPEQPAGDFFQSVNGRHDGEYGPQFVEFQVVFLA